MEPRWETGIGLPNSRAAQQVRDVLDALDSELRAAVHDVDRSLIRLSLAQTPRARLRSSSNMISTLMRLRRARTSARR
jgi:hypothetical protein